MNLTINNIDYELHFGLDFISALDRNHYSMQGGVKFGQGIVYAIGQIETGNPTVLFDLIQAATCTEKKRPGLVAIKKYIEECAEDGSMEDLFNDFLSALETAPLIRFQLKKLGRLVEEMVEQQKLGKQANS